MEIRATIDFEIDPGLILNLSDIRELWQTRFDDFMCTYPKIISYEVTVGEA